MRLLLGIILLSVLLIEILGIDDNKCIQNPGNAVDCNDNGKISKCVMYNFDWNFALQSVTQMSEADWTCEKYYLVSTNVQRGITNTYWITWKSQIGGKTREIHSHISAELDHFHQVKLEGGNAHIAYMKDVPDQRKIKNVHLKNEGGKNIWLIHPKKVCDFNTNSASISNLRQSLEQNGGYIDHLTLLRKLQDAYDEAYNEARPAKKKQTLVGPDYIPKSINSNMENVLENFGSLVNAYDQPSTKEYFFNEVKSKEESEFPLVFVSKVELEAKISQLERGDDACRRREKNIVCGIKNLQVLKVSWPKNTKIPKIPENIEIEILRGVQMNFVVEPRINLKISSIPELQIVYSVIPRSTREKF